MISDSRKSDTAFETAFVDATRNDKLELFILPTEQCNFRCVYCYEDFSIGKMKRPVIDGIKNFLKIRATDLKYLKIQWFGGEPLLQVNTVKEISEYVCDIVQTHPSLRAEGIMTTNGYLLNKELLKELILLKVTTYQISLDGTQHLHDKTRIRAGGQATYERIMKNLHDARDLSEGFRIIIRIHLTPENVGEIHELIDFLKKSFFGDKRFVPHIVPVGKLGGKNDSNFSVLSADQAVSLKSKLLEVLMSQSEPSTKPDAPSVCYASKPNSLIVRSDGRLAKCTVALNDHRNSLGEIKEDGSVIIDNPKLQKWLLGWERRSLLQLECPLEFLTDL